MPPKKTSAPIDVLVITALKDEFDALLKVNTGAAPGSSWEEGADARGRRIAYRNFLYKGKTAKTQMRVVATYATEMGQVATAEAVTALLNEFQGLRCLTMSGICAGRRGKVNLGDVIIGERLWWYDSGKTVVETDEEGNRQEKFLADIRNYNMDAVWRQRAEGWGPTADADWLKDRPYTYEQQELWLLKCLLNGEEPGKHLDSEKHCANWKLILQSLREKKQLHSTKIELTKKGKARIELELQENRNKLSEPEPFQVHLAPIGTGAQVLEDEGIFERLSRSMRKVLGLEMEANAIGAVWEANRHDIPWMLVMKAVSDYGDTKKNDNFREFAARSSAECLLEFLRENLPPAEPSPGFDDLLDDGMRPPPEYRNPAALLDSRYRIVPFYEPGRKEILSDLDAWRTKNNNVSIRLLYGPGGIGKTRLMTEWCERLRKKDWNAGFLRKNSPADWYERLNQMKQPALVVLDYAESTANLSEFLGQALSHYIAGSESSIKIVLLTRNRGDWWESLLSRDVDLKDLLTQVEPREVLPLSMNPEERRLVFEQAKQTFAGVFGKNSPVNPQQDLSDQVYDRVLYIHAAAMATVQGWNFSAKTLLEEVLEHEERFWLIYGDKTRTQDEEDAWRDKVRQVMGAATLRGGFVTSEEVIEIGACITGESISKTELKFFERVYGSPSQDLFLDPMLPDLMGEALILRLLHRDQDGKLPPGYILDVFRANNILTLRRGFEVLGRIGVDYPGEAKTWIRRLLSENLTFKAPLAFMAALGVGASTAFSPLANELTDRLEEEGTAEVAGLLLLGLPKRSVSMRRLAVWVTSNFLDLFEGDDLKTRAIMLSDLSVRQGELGLLPESLKSVQEAVEINRALVKGMPDAVLPDLAMSLDNLGLAQGKLGLYKEALVSSREGLKIRRRLVGERGDSVFSDLVLSLNNLSDLEENSGSHAEAFAYIQEAVDICRKLVQKNRGAHLSELAWSLINLGSRQGGLGSIPNALRSTQEAVKYYRELVQLNRDVYLSDLATSLNSLADRQGHSGLLEAALQSSHEAIKIRRELAKLNRKTFLPALVVSLNSLATRQNELGQLNDALESSQEAVRLSRELVNTNRDAHASELAGCLNTLGVAQKSLGLNEVAIKSAQEAIDLFRELVGGNRNAFLSKLGACLSNIGMQQHQLGLVQEALHSCEEAVEINRELIQTNRDAFLPLLAGSLNNLSICQNKSGLGEDTLKSTRESLGYYQELAKVNRESYLPDIAAGLNNLGNRQGELKLYEAALDSIREAVKLRRELGNLAPDAFLPVLAESLLNQGRVQAQLGLHDESIKSNEEALELLWPYFEKNPQAYAQTIQGIFEMVTYPLAVLGRSPSPVFLERAQRWAELTGFNPEAE